MDNLHREIIIATADLRKRLAATDDMGGTFTLAINIIGRIQDGEVKCDYKLCHNYGADTTGHSLEPVIVEFLRRNGWEKTNTPLALPAPTDMYKEADDQPATPVPDKNNDDLPF